MYTKFWGIVGDIALFMLYGVLLGAAFISYVNDLFIEPIVWFALIICIPTLILFFIAFYSLKIKKPQQKAYEEGYEDGETHGYNQGYNKAWEEQNRHSI